MNSQNRTPTPTCAACLGDHTCWVCLGQGRCERADKGFDVCVRCRGTGACPYCRPPLQVDVTTPELPAPAAGSVRLIDGYSPPRINPVDRSDSALSA